MVSAGEVLRLGPFTGGLNLSSDPTSVADAELVECVNLELDIEGSLKSRPPYVIVDDDNTTIEGHIIIGSALFGSTAYLFSSGVDSAGVESIRSSTDGITWTAINGANERFSVACIQYRDKVWFVAHPNSTNGGMSWDPIGGLTAIATMPRGMACVVHKERLYVCAGRSAVTNNSRLTFSEPADLTTWGASDFIDVSPGDGESLNDILVYNDNLLLFKDASTHVLAYDLNPADAILREINPVIGVDAEKKSVQFENVAYILHDDIVYEIVNYDFNPINIKVPFVLDQTIPPATQPRTIDSSLSLLGNRLITRFFAKTYVYGFRTKTWSEWKSTFQPTSQWHELTPLVKLPASNPGQYFAMRNFDESTHVFKMRDLPVANEDELGTGTIACHIRTKDFDIADPVHFKKLYWWSADVLTGNNVIGAASPITIAFSPSWEQLEDSGGDLAWEELGSWESLLDTPSSTTTQYTGDNNFAISKTYKFMKGLRFRKINFVVLLVTDGSLTQPSKIFSLTATVRTKQAIVKTVS